MTNNKKDEIIKEYEKNLKKMAKNELINMLIEVTDKYAYALSMLSSDQLKRLESNSKEIYETPPSQLLSHKL